MENFLKRLAVAAVGIPSAILIIYYGSWLFLVTVVIVASLALFEFYALAEKKNIAPHKISGIIFGIALIVFIYFNTKNNFSELIFITFITFVLIIFLTELFKKKQNAMLNISHTIAGLAYVTLSFGCMVNIREFYQLKNSINYTSINTGLAHSFNVSILNTPEQSAWFLLSILIGVWICDTMAYFVGHSIGKHKFFPRISPKKTWEGAIGGLVGGIAGFTAATLVIVPQFPIFHSIIIGFIIGTIGQLGDLAESQLKRDVGVKDSSQIIPGHGGMLDRFDSILFVMPAVYLYLILLLNIF